VSYLSNTTRCAKDEAIALILVSFLIFQALTGS